MAYDIHNLMALKEEYADKAFDARMKNAEFRLEVLRHLERLVLFAKRTKNKELLALVQDFRNDLEKIA